VRCAADGCGHSVYKRVHIVRFNGETRVYGEDCFQHLFGRSLSKAKPKLTSAKGRKLSDEERAILVANTCALIERWESESAVTTTTSVASRREDVRPARYSTVPNASPEERTMAEIEARQILNEKLPGLDFDSPGFNGLLQMQIDRILRAKTG
jgi:hypothetical protein